MLLHLAVAAWGASLDNLEIGGPFGTPAATDATAVWWNPAGLSGESGTRFLVEGAPLFATVQYDRVDPYGHGGSDTYLKSGVIPFAAVASDLGVKGLGLGAGLVVPYARGGAESPNPGPGRYHMRDGSSQSAHFIGAASYAPIPELSFGASFQVAESAWRAQVEMETMTALAHQLEEKGADTDYTDDQIETEPYSATANFVGLSDTAFTFSGGVRVVPDDQLAISLAYVHGYRVENRGDVRIDFQCPPQDDVLGRFGAEGLGLCHSSVNGDGEVAYQLPSRLHGGVRYVPKDGVTLEVLGGWVGWGAYTDFEITVSNADVENEAAAAVINSERRWARANRASFWGGVDAKFDIDDRFLVGGRVLYDHAAVPLAALSPNNYDASAVMITAMGGWRPIPQLYVGASLTQHVLAKRTVVDSGFAVTLDEEHKNEDRWFYPHAAGAYSASITRAGIQVGGRFGPKDEQ